MIDTIMFDLDGTLVRISQSDFLENYLAELRKVFIKMGLNADHAVKALWIGTKAMVLNDGQALNSHRFWHAFADSLELGSEWLNIIEEACDGFYTNEFNRVKDFIEPSEIPQRLVHAMKKKGYCVVLATNPLFPFCAVESRLEWIGLEAKDFELVTHYNNSTFCKPNHHYYTEIFGKIKKAPKQCMMVGNNPEEDMCVTQLGLDVFLITDYMENDAGININAFRHGTINDMEEYLMSLPDIG